MAIGQVQNRLWEGRPKISSAIDLLPRTRLDTWIESQHGLDFSYQRFRTGGLISRRVKPILNLPLRDIDENNDHYLVFGGGYEYLYTVDEGKLTIDNTIIAYATPHILLAGLLFSDRNRVEFRWLNGVHNYRYRNRLTIVRESRLRGFRYTPYAYGELFYHSKQHAWNASESAAGVQFPYESRFMVDTYWLHEDCSSCRHSSVNMIGVTLNFYLRQVE
jgi:hypothetical protein